MYCTIFSWGRPRQKLAEKIDQKERKANEEKEKKAEDLEVPVGVDPSLVQTLPYDPEVAAAEIATSPVEVMESPMKSVLDTENSWWKCEQYFLEMKKFKEQQEEVPDSQTHGTDDAHENLSTSLQEASLEPIAEPEVSPQPQLSAASKSDEPKVDEISQPSAPGAQSKLDAGAEAFEGVPNTDGEQKVSEGDEKEGGEVEKVKESGGTQDPPSPVEQPLDSVPKPEDDEVEIVEPPNKNAYDDVGSPTPESSKPVDHSIGLLEDMLKHGLDLTTAIGHLKSGTWPCPKADGSKADGSKGPDGSKAPVVRRIAQFKNKTGQPMDVPDDDDDDDEGSKPPARRKAEPKPKGKGRGKGKGKTKAAPKVKAKAKAKSLPKGKAKGKAKNVKGKGSEDKVEAEDSDEKEVEDTETEDADKDLDIEDVQNKDVEPKDVEPKDVETKDVEPEDNEKPVDKKKKRKAESEKEETPDQKPASKKPKKDAKSFARRPCPSTSPAKDKWIAISQTFKSQVQQQILEAGEKVSKWEERGKGVSGRCWQGALLSSYTSLCKMFDWVDGDGFFMIVFPVRSLS